MKFPFVSRARLEAEERHVMKLETWRAEDFEALREQKQEAIGERSMLMDQIKDLVDKIVGMKKEGFEPSYPAPVLAEPELSDHVWRAIQSVANKGSSEYADLVTFATEQKDVLSEDEICDSIVRGLDIEI